MRGKPEASERSIAALGITPAGAGKTAMLSSLKTAYRDHPRRCGENTSRDSFFLPGKGSPPQVRGKHCNVLSQRTAIGITPAGAGKTYRQHEHVETAEDHPRRCGENPQSPAQIFRALGSPPQVRGKPTPLQSHAPLSGITPAGAGKTMLLLVCSVN